jgi:hypothetical protein
MGNQIVRWGKTDEVSPLDNLNPEDLRDGFPRRRDERKLPIPMVNLELFKEMYKLQGIFIPFFVESKYDLRDTDWAYFDHIAKKVGPFGIQEEHVPDTLSNSEVGVRFSGTIGTFDYGFSYQYAREDVASLGSLILPPGFPSAPFDTDLKDLAQFAQLTNQQIVLENNRRNIYGFEFETVLGSFGLRGDVAYIYQRNFLNDRLKSIRKPVIEYVLGADYNGPGSFYFNLQFVQAIILNYDHGIIANDEITTGIDGDIYKRFFDDNITLDLRFFHNITNNAYYYNPNILIEYWENVSLELGLDLIGGPTYTAIGYFRDNDQVYGILRVHF